MEGEHTPTIIQLILSADLAVIQLKDSHLILHISQQKNAYLKHPILHLVVLTLIIEQNANSFITVT